MRRPAPPVAAPAEDPAISDVLEFWFGAPGSPEHGQERDLWWNQDPQVDQRVRQQFAALHALALAGQLHRWAAGARGALALVLVLDQFSRHLYRQDPRAYDGDAAALAVARSAVARGWDLALPPVQRQFLYMPFMHAEELEAQDRSVQLFDALAEADPAVDQRRWAHEYRELIRRAGRFPHRDAVLGR